MEATPQNWGNDLRLLRIFPHLSQNVPLIDAIGQLIRSITLTNNFRGRRFDLQDSQRGLVIQLLPSYENLKKRCIGFIVQFQQLHERGQRADRVGGANGIMSEVNGDLRGENIWNRRC
jgi:hypothetical protein